MNVIIDACSVINLHNAGVLETVCSMEGINVQIGPIAGGECLEDCAESLARLHAVGNLEYLEDSPIDGDDFVEFVAEHKLGDGEAECILLAQIDQTASVCCDDMRGRRKAQQILGAERLVGSLKLLKMAVCQGLLPAREAFDAYERMKQSGGFLPAIPEEYFALNS